VYKVENTGFIRENLSDLMSSAGYTERRRRYADLSVFCSYFNLASRSKKVHKRCGSRMNRRCGREELAKREVDRC
jgi:hypothetical protein